MQTNVSADNQLIDHPIDLIETLAASRRSRLTRHRRRRECLRLGNILRLSSRHQLAS